MRYWPPVFYIYKKYPSIPLIHILIIFEYMFKFTQLLKFETHSAYYPNLQKQLVRTRLSNYRFYNWLVPSLIVHPHSKFWSSVHFKSCRRKKFNKNIRIHLNTFAEYAEWNSTSIENVPNEIVHSLRICKIKFDVYWEYAKYVMFLLSIWIIHRMKVYVLYTEKKWNDIMYRYTGITPEWICM
jgi:hypothetical protein